MRLSLFQRGIESRTSGLCERQAVRGTEDADVAAAAAQREPTALPDAWGARPVLLLESGERSQRMSRPSETPAEQLRMRCNGQQEARPEWVSVEGELEQPAVESVNATGRRWAARSRSDAGSHLARLLNCDDVHEAIGFRRRAGSKEGIIKMSRARRPGSKATGRRRAARAKAEDKAGEEGGELKL